MSRRHRERERKALNPPINPPGKGAQPGFDRLAPAAARLSAARSTVCAHAVRSGARASLSGLALGALSERGVRHRPVFDSLASVLRLRRAPLLRSAECAHRWTSGGGLQRCAGRGALEIRGLFAARARVCCLRGTSALALCPSRRGRACTGSGHPPHTKRPTNAQPSHAQRAAHSLTRPNDNSAEALSPPPPSSTSERAAQDTPREGSSHGPRHLPAARAADREEGDAHSDGAVCRRAGGGRAARTRAQTHTTPRALARWLPPPRSTRPSLARTGRTGRRR